MDGRQLIIPVKKNVLKESLGSGRHVKKRKAKQDMKNDTTRQYKIKIRLITRPKKYISSH